MFQKKNECSLEAHRLKAWCLLSFLLEVLNHNGNTRPKHKEQHKIKELSDKQKTLMEFEKLHID